MVLRIQNNIFEKENIDKHWQDLKSPSWSQSGSRFWMTRQMMMEEEEQKVLREKNKPGQALPGETL